jgi:predicted alpha/beta-hydrolase family hydrolase
MNPTHVNASRKFFSRDVVEISDHVASMMTITRPSSTFSRHQSDPATMCAMKVVLGHGASGNAASMKPYVVGFKRRGIDAMAVDLPRGGAEKAVPVFIKASGRGHDVVGGGQSFGGRVASMAAVDADYGALVLFSYPLHRPGFKDQLRTEHWPRIKCPTLFLSGDRDPFADLALLRQKIKIIANARLVVFEGQGHGLLKVLDDALDVATDFLKSELR